jgi:hypothetical protein
MRGFSDQLLYGLACLDFRYCPGPANKLSAAFFGVSASAAITHEDVSFDETHKLDCLERREEVIQELLPAFICLGRARQGLREEQGRSHVHIQNNFVEQMSLLSLQQMTVYQIFDNITGIKDHDATLKIGFGHLAHAAIKCG